MISVHLDSPTNSTIFTNCCNVAILPYQAKCPACDDEVFPGKEHSNYERERMRWNVAYGKQKGQP